VDGQGNVYLADTSNNRILRYSSTGTPSMVVGSNVGLSAPTGVAVDNSGNIYIADTGNARIRKVEASGNLSNLAGSGISGFGGDNGPASQARIAPNDVAYFGGSLYIADMYNNRIRKVDLSTKIITTVVGTGDAGNAGDGGPALSAQLNEPRGLALDAAGNLYIADWGNAVVRRVSNGIITTIAGNGNPVFNVESGTGLSVSIDPTRVAVDRDGSIYINDVSNDRIRMLRPQAAGGLSLVGGGLTGGAGSKISIAVKVLDLAGLAVGNMLV